MTKNKPRITEVNVLKADVQLFSRLFIVSTARDLDLNTFFEYENQVCPPALSVNGEIRGGVKADLTVILESLVTSKPPNPDKCDGIVFDGATFVHMVKPRPSLKSFSEYFQLQIKPHITRLMETHGSQRVDFVWDLYHPNSIKNTTRKNRGSGLRKQDLPTKGKFV